MKTRLGLEKNDVNDLFISPKKSYFLLPPVLYVSGFNKIDMA